MIILPEDHYSITSANDVAEICSSLFEQYNLSYFLYARIFDNGTTYSLISHAEYQQHHLKKGYLVTPPIPPKILNKNFSYLLTGNEGPFQPVLKDMRELFNLWYPFFLIERYLGFYDLYMFCTTPNNRDIINFYINNLDVLENFKFYFKNKAIKLIAKSQENLLVIPHSMRSTFGGLIKATIETEINKQKFLKKITAQHYKLTLDNISFILTKREIDCLKHLERGRTFKEAAKLMHISPRTVEYHINNVKSKLNVKKKSQIIDVLFQSILTDL